MSMRLRETKYPNRAALRAAIEWHSRDTGSWLGAYTAGKLLPADMPDDATRTVADVVEMYITLAESHFGRLLELLEEEDGEG